MQLAIKIVVKVPQEVPDLKKNTLWNLQITSELFTSEQTLKNYHFRSHPEWSHKVFITLGTESQQYRSLSPNSNIPERGTVFLLPPNDQSYYIKHLSQDLFFKSSQPCHGVSGNCRSEPESCCLAQHVVWYWKTYAARWLLLEPVSLSQCERLGCAFVAVEGTEE